jgi:hypothetical protein
MTVAESAGIEDESRLKEQIKRIYEALPRMNCGRCGFESCGGFARAVAEGKASPFGCRQDHLVGYTISRIVGARIPGELASVSGPGLSSSPEAFGQDIKGLSNRVDSILAQIEKLKAEK